METDLFVGGLELLEALCRQARSDPTFPVTVDEITHRVDWTAEDVRAGLAILHREGLVRWGCRGEVPDRQFVCITVRGLHLRRAGAPPPTRQN